MKLRDYLKEKDLDRRQFAELVGVSIPTIQGIVGVNHHGRSPSLKVATEIEEITKGRVTAREMFYEAMNKTAPSLGQDEGAP